MFTGNAFAVFAYPLLIVVIIAIQRYSGGGVIDIVARMIFGIYVIAALRVTLTPIPVDGLMAQDYARAGVPFLSNFNLNVFKIPQGSIALSQAMKNVLLGIPFGLGLGFVSRTNSLKAIALFSLLASLFIEILQLVIGLAIGFMYRSVDAQDVLFNTLGGAIGASAFALMRIAWSKWARGIQGGLTSDFLRRSFHPES